MDWWAVANRRSSLEYVCKPLASTAFLATAIAVDAAHGDTRTWFCIALACCVLGDVFLMLPGDRFVPGLASFLVAQLCFAVGLSPQVDDTLRLALGIVVVAVVATLLAGRFLRALVRAGRRSLAVPVGAYILAIGTMSAMAIGAGGGFGVVGAGLFFVSDALIAETRFVRPRPASPLVVMVTYHLAIAALVFSLLR